MQPDPHVYAVIMAGGSGTRFWPLSREAMPKQLLKIGGEETLIQKTINRIGPMVPQERVFIVTNKQHGDQIRFQVPSLNKENFILEPDGRNTAPAIGLAAVHLRKKDPDAVMVVLAADHVIQRQDVFRHVVEKAVCLAGVGHLVTLGVVPTRPETGYGYIQAGEPVGSEDAFRIARFVEKPDLPMAKSYLKDGHYFWNSGMFVWKAETILAEMQTHMPEFYQELLKIEEAIGTEMEKSRTEEIFRRLQPISIDYGVMEKSDKGFVIPADLGWNDVGSWTALDEIASKDPSGNVTHGKVVGIENLDSILYANGGRLVAAVGLKDLIVVDTEDATLVCAKERAQDVKKVVETLKKRGGDEHLIHRTVIRPWGAYTLLEKGERYKIKRIVVNPGAKLSFQMHHHRSEHWVVVSGTARVTRNEEVYYVNPNESTYIPMETKHRLENPGKIPLQIIEVQNGEYLEEDDIIRFDDLYGRSDT